MEEIDTSGAGAHPHWPDRFFARLVDAYLARTGNEGGRVGDAVCFLVDAPGLLAFVLPVMQAIAGDPHAARRVMEAG